MGFCLTAFFPPIISSNLRLWTPNLVKGPRLIREIISIRPIENRGITFPLVILKFKANEF